MSKALARVKRELGPEAVILRTRTLRRGGLLGVGARQVVQIIASQPRLAGGDFRPAEKPVAAPLHPPPENPTPQIGLAEDVRQIRQMVHRMIRLQVTQPRPDLPDALFNQYLGLLEQEVGEELVEQIIQATLTQLDRTQAGDSQIVRTEVERQIAALIPAAAEMSGPAHPEDARPYTVALVGPTGVGKTTTVAKLAAHYKLRRGMRIALITLDTYRIAAVDQIKTYAEILGLPLHVVATPEQMTEAMVRCRGLDAVLIDTAGRSPRDGERLGELQRLLAVARPQEVHLVLACNVSQAALADAIDRFTPVGFDRVLFTKLDEAIKYGVLLNIARKVGAPLSYLTTGQEVPHRIEPGDPRRIAQLIVGEKL